MFVNYVYFVIMLYFDGKCLYGHLRYSNFVRTLLGYKDSKPSIAHHTYYMQGSLYYRYIVLMTSTHVVSLSMIVTTLG